MSPIQDTILWLSDIDFLVSVSGKCLRFRCLQPDLFLNILKKYPEYIFTFTLKTLRDLQFLRESRLPNQENQKSVNFETFKSENLKEKYWKLKHSKLK